MRLGRLGEMTPREATFLLAWPLWALAEGCCRALTYLKRWSDGTTGTVRVKWESNEPKDQS